MIGEYDHTQEWYRTDIKEEFFDYLDKVGVFFEMKDTCPSYWKWVIISYHGALYHLMLVVLRNTDGSGVYKNELRTKQGRLDFSREDEMDLISFGEAFRRIQDEKRMGGYMDAKPFTSNESINEGKESLNRWRNNFVHYKPKGWSIGIEIFRESIERTLPIFEFLLTCSRRPSFVAKEEEKFRRIEEVLKRLKM